MMVGFFQDLKTSRVLLFGGALAILLNDAAAWGRTYSELESVAVQNIRSAMEGYAELNTGQYPTNWSQVDEQLDLDQINRKLRFQKESCPIQAHYVFIQELIMAPPPARGDVVFIRTTAYKHPESGLGRYLISKSTNGLFYAWLPESAVQSMLTQTKVSLPQTDAAVVRAAEEELKKFQEWQKQWHRDIERDSWLMRWIELRSTVKGWFVSSGGTNSQVGLAGQEPGGTLKPIPIALAIVGALGVGWAVLRLSRRRRRAQEIVSCK
jgi:hypothetical protein